MLPRSELSVTSCYGWIACDDAMTHDGENKNTNLTRSEEKGEESKSGRSRADGGNATSTNSRKIAKDASSLIGTRIPQVSDTTINIITATDSHGNNSDARGDGESAARTRRQSKNGATTSRSNVFSTDDSVGPDSLGQPPMGATTDNVDADSYNDADVLGPRPDTENASTINSKSLLFVDSTGIGGGNETQLRPQPAPADAAEALVEVPGEVNSSGRNKDRRRRSKRLASATSLSSAEISPRRKDGQNRSQPRSRRTPSSSSSSSSNTAKPQNEARDDATSSPSSAAATAKALKSVPSESKRRKRSRAARALSMDGGGDEDQGLLLQAEANPITSRMSTTRTANTSSASHDPALASPDAALEKAAAREATPSRDSAVAGSTTINISADTGSLISGKSGGAAVAVAVERGQERGKVRYAFWVCASTMSYTRYCITFLAQLEAGHLCSASVWSSIIVDSPEPPTRVQ